MFKLAGIAFATVMLTQAMALPGSKPATTGPSSNPAPSGLPQNARFDNDVGIPAVAVGPINVYLDILWKGMSLAETSASSTEDLPGLIPNSPPNCAAFAPGDTAGDLQGTPEMTVVYDDSTISNFTLSSFFYGCVVGTEESEAAVPISCTITLTGFSPSGKQIAQQNFPFVANGLEQQMIEAYPMGFTQVQFITFIIQAPNATKAALIDTVQYTIFSK